MTVNDIEKIMKNHPDTLFPGVGGQDIVCQLLDYIKFLQCEISYLEEERKAVAATLYRPRIFKSPNTSKIR
jgi:hypothetical protein